jgi:hypothetical protein
LKYSVYPGVAWVSLLFFGPVFSFFNASLPFLSFVLFVALSHFKPTLIR